jgi:hypothetical protein
MRVHVLAHPAMLVAKLWINVHARALPRNLKFLAAGAHRVPLLQKTLGLPLFQPQKLPTRPRPPLMRPPKLGQVVWWWWAADLGEC